MISYGTGDVFRIEHPFLKMINFSPGQRIYIKEVSNNRSK